MMFILGWLYWQSVAMRDYFALTCCVTSCVTIVLFVMSLTPSPPEIDLMPPSLPTATTTATGFLSRRF